MHDPLDVRRRIEFESAVAEIAASIVEHTSGDSVTMTLEVRALPDRVDAEPTTVSRYTGAGIHRADTCRIVG
ncbi:hypothetical protein OPAG_04144 [Rhodococcus opacus PD630]|uniref:hypothetical protein n=1 Tax=Rhodococcus opacus TaxID=37919 RepID=UPI00029CCE5F|nr:hypothetical protein [Rhodococcus opacus]AHK31073.1 hypothetical protein Pd630_LPD03860 [Rhodococcus opacus PD630]EHI47340.1 hypothetical protein OPAG_04144 [Rhodococcus opacus PD630]UDH01133.1 hypothetical protein K2Z90_003658 [Rhodococcus opacus PD630]